MNTKSYDPHSVRVVAGATLLSALVACGGLEPDVGMDSAGLETISRVYVTPQVINGVFTVHGDDELVPGNPDGLDDDTEVVVMELLAEPRNFDTHADFAYFLLELGGVWTEDATLAEGVVDLELEETGPIYSEAFEGTEGLLEIDDALLAHIGGATGAIEVGGVSYCIDLDEDCSNGYPSYLEPVDFDMLEDDPAIVSKRKEVRRNSKMKLKGKAGTRDLLFWKRVRVKSKVKSRIGKKRLETRVDGTAFFFDPLFGWFTDPMSKGATKTRGKRLSAKRARHAVGFFLTFGNDASDPKHCDRTSPGAAFRGGCPSNFSPRPGGPVLGLLEHSQGICSTFFGKVDRYTKTFSFGDGGSTNSPCLEQGL